GAPTFDQAWEGSQQARNAAVDRNARRQETIARDKVKGRITADAAQVRQRASRLKMLEEIYRTAVKPYEGAAARNCAIGRAVVMFDLEKLAREWAKETGQSEEQSPFWDTLQKLAREVRCRCARELIDRCENEFGVSGSALLVGMKDLLSDSSAITGRSDAQGCALGSDAEILARLESGPCFGPWEGTVKIQRVTTVAGTLVEGVRTRTWDDERREIYQGTIQRVVSERNFTVGGRRVQSWNIATGGRFFLSEFLDERIKQDAPDSDVIMHTLTRRNDAEHFHGVGTIVLRLENGAFTSLGIDGGAAPDVPGRHITYTERTQLNYECKDSYPKDRECPAGSTSSSTGTIGLYMGISVDTGTVPPVQAQVGVRSVNIRWSNSTTNESAFRPPRIETETVTVDMVRKG
ncbi:MAG: hypothetical protein IT580_14865, partial [Verrucomicrobiales bacterium]|nr:hypothetical protein [Verrucomicrobiales bacterium]